MYELFGSVYRMTSKISDQLDITKAKIILAWQNTRKREFGLSNAKTWVAFVLSLLTSTARSNPDLDEAKQLNSAQADYLNYVLVKVNTVFATAESVSVFLHERHAKDVNQTLLTEIIATYKFQKPKVNKTVNSIVLKEENLHVVFKIQKNLETTMLIHNKNFAIRSNEDLADLTARLKKYELPKISISVHTNFFNRVFAYSPSAYAGVQRFFASALASVGLASQSDVWLAELAEARSAIKSEIEACESGLAKRRSMFDCRGYSSDFTRPKERRALLQNCSVNRNQNDCALLSKLDSAYERYQTAQHYPGWQRHPEPPMPTFRSRNAPAVATW